MKRNNNFKSLISEFKENEKNNLNYWTSKLEKYSKENVLHACLSSGTSKEIAEKIVKEIDGHVDTNIPMSEIRPLIFSRLYFYDIKAANKFKTGEVFVRRSEEKFEGFCRDRITKSLMKETELDEKIAAEIALEAENFIKTFNITYVSSPLIREIVCVKLLEHGLEDARKDYTRLGTPVYDIKQMISRGVSTDIKRENANLQHTPETINWILSGETLEQYSLLKLIPPKLADPHLAGDYHIHILSNIATRPNCIQHYPPMFFKNGLKVDGTGMHTSIAGPPKHLSVAIQHCAKILLSSQTQMAGGQSIDCFNVWLAPFLKGMTDDQVKQVAQEFIYELNQSYVSRGGQVVFSNVDFEFGIPEWLKNVPAVGSKGQIMGVYGDYEEESLKFLREYIKLKIKGDHKGKQHMWPNDVFKVRNDTFKKYPDEVKLVHEFMAKYGTPYIANGIPEWQTENFNYMGCLASDTPLPYINENSNHLCSIGNLAERYAEKFGTKTYGISTYTEPENLFVYSWNSNKNIIEKKKVLKIIKNPPAPMVKIEVMKNKQITVTLDHPFYRKNKSNKIEEVKAGELEENDIILTANLKKLEVGYSKINNLSYLNSGNFVYDLEVEDNHTFISGHGLFIHSNCRTRLDSKFAGPWGTQRTGNDVYITLNLPRIAYESKGNDDKFFEILQERLKKMAEILLLKHQITDNSLHRDCLLPFLTQKMGDEEYYQLKNTTKTFGYAGLTEATKIHCGNHLHENKDAQAFGFKVIKFIRDYADEMIKETGLRFSVIASPAETCAARLVKLDFSKFGNNVIFSGTKESPYYTNSHMVKMDANLPLAEKIKIEEAYHPLTNGGHILHIWLGEQSPSAESLLELSKKICKTNIGFFAYTKDYSICNPCSSFQYGLKQACNNCGSDNLSRYSRITGYYQRVEGWNPSKKQELKDRYRFDHKTCNCE